MYRLRLTGGMDKKLFALPEGKARFMEDGEVVQDDDAILKMYPSYFVQLNDDVQILNEQPTGDAEIETDSDVETAEPDLKNLVKNCTSKKELIDLINKKKIDVPYKGNIGFEKLKTKVLEVLG